MGPLAMNATYKFSFEVTNLGQAQDAQQIKITSFMSSAGIGGTNVGGVMEMSRSQEPLSTLDSTAEIIIADRSEAGLTIDPRDTHPLFVRQVRLLTHNISQSTSLPCDDNTITVSLQSNVPLLVTPKSHCQPAFILKGLTWSNTLNHPALSISDVQKAGSSATGILTANGTWQHMAGRLDFASAGGFLAGPVYTFTFVLENPARGQSAPPVSIQVTGLGNQHAFVEMQGNETFFPLKVDYADIIHAGALQTSDTPCQESTITISMQTSVQLVQACQTTLTIRGLRNSLSDSTALDSSSTSGFTLVSWDRADGKLILNTSSTMPAAGYSFSFTLRNPPFGQERQPVTIEGNIWNRYGTSSQQQLW